MYRTDSEMHEAIAELVALVHETGLIYLQQDGPLPGAAGWLDPALVAPSGEC